MLSADKRALFARLLAQEGLADARGTIPPRPRDGGPVPLSFAQQRLWITDRLSPGTTAYNVAAVLRLDGVLSVDGLERALTELVSRHESLRTTFAVAGDSPVQVIGDPYPVSVPVQDLESVPASDQEARVRQLAAQEAQRPFDLASDALLRVSLLRLGARAHRLLVTMHHIISDGWSVAVLVRELTSLYTLAVQQKPLRLPDASLQYADFAVWQRQPPQADAIEEQLTYWRTQLAGAPTWLSLPSDRPRPAAPTFRGALHRFALPRPLLDDLRALSRLEDVTFYMTLLAAFQTLLHRYTGETDLLVGTPVASRSRRELEGIIGFFVNVLVMRGDLSGDPPVRELLRRTRDACLAAYAHQDVPFERLVGALAPTRHPGCTPFFQVMFALQNAPESGIELPGLDVIVEDGDTASAPFDLTLSVRESQDGLVGSFEYSTDLFDTSTIERMTDHFRTTLEQIVKDPGRRLSALPITSGLERRRVLTEWNGAHADTPAGSLPDLFDAQAERAPAAVAVIWQDAGRAVPVTYAELAERSNRLANSLRERGVGPDTCVGICLTRSMWWPTALLGVLKAGGACVLLDPAWPRERIRQAIDAGGLDLVLTESSLAGAFEGSSARTIALDTAWTSMSSGTEAQPAGSIDGEQLAFVIYTSGSTGVPKGVMVPHRAVVNHCVAIADEYDLRPSDRVLQFSSPAFDVAIEELFPAWSRGAAVWLRPWTDVPSIPEFVRFLDAERISVVNLPSSFWHAWVDALPVDASMPDALRLVVAGSERTSSERLRQWSARVRVDWRNAYGATETTITTAIFDPRGGAAGVGGPVVPVGRPIANTEIFVLDRHLEPMPIGIAGELYVGGAGVSRGYQGDPANTAERFVPHPFSSQRGARLYRTGDRGRWRADGSLEVLGRIDRQVKVRGVRIEPGEIEEALRRHPAIRECAVTARDDAAGDVQLIAYIGVMPGSDASSASVREFLLERLPGAMVPSAFVWLDALPTTAAGKIDYRALAAVAVQPSRAPYEPPRNETEALLAGIWAEVLRQERVGVHDNFFELGGHSLMAAQIASRVSSRLHIDVPLRELFEHPTIASLAARLARPIEAPRTGLTPQIVPVARTESLPLSLAQEQLWVIQRTLPDLPLFNMPFSVWLTGVLDIDALDWTLNEIVRRHEVLRTTFAEVDGRPVQTIVPSAPLTLNAIDLSVLAAPDIGVEGARLIAAEAYRPIDLTSAPLMRAAVLRLASENHVVLLTLPHIAGDLWSVDALRREVEILYAARIAGQRSPLPELPVQYADYAVWQREWLDGEEAASQLRYWRERLRPPLPSQDLPLDRPRTSALTFETASATFTLASGLSEAMRLAGTRAGCTLFMMALTAFKLALADVTGQTDVRVATLAANRTRLELEGLIGLFANTLILRTDLSGNATFEAMLRRVRETTLEGYAHQDLPFDVMVERLKTEHDEAIGMSLSRVLVLWQDADQVPLRLPGLTARPLTDVNPLADFSITPTVFDLIVTLGERADGMLAHVKYKTALFERATVERLFAGVERVLQGAVAASEQRPWG